MQQMRRDIRSEKSMGVSHFSESSSCKIHVTIVRSQVKPHLFVIIGNRYLSPLSRSSLTPCMFRDILVIEM
jgi:hypothetical protein